MIASKAPAPFAIILSDLKVFEGAETAKQLTVINSEKMARRFMMEQIPNQFSFWA